MKKRFFVLTALFSVIFVNLLYAEDSEKVDYMAILLDGHKIGHAIHTRTVEGSQVTTIEEIHMLIGRGPAAIQYTGKEVTVESVSGKPLSFEITQNISGMKQFRKGTISEGKVKMTIQNGPTEQHSEIAYPSGALMTEGLRLMQIKKGLDAGQHYDFLLFRPDMDQAVPAQVKIGPKNKIDLLGRIVELSEVKVVMQFGVQSVSVTSYVNENYDPLKTIVPMMGMNLELIVCEKEFALGQDDIVDFMEKFCVAGPVEIGKTDLAGPITYVLTATADKPLVIPNTDTQTVEEVEPGNFHVTVHPAAPQKPVKNTYEGKEETILKALEPTEYLQTKDEKIVDLVKRAVTGNDDMAKTAFQIEKFVMDYITQKDLSVGYASAAEVARSQQGDCSEHALLATAMCRAAGIPARVVCGVVYVDSIGIKKHVFGAHMWTEMYLDGKWFSIDATRAPNGFSAGHIALAVGGGDPSDFFSLINTLGWFKIEKVILPSS